MKQIIKIRRRDGITQRYRVGRRRSESCDRVRKCKVCGNEKLVYCSEADMRIPWTCKACKERTQTERQRRMARLYPSELRTLNKDRKKLLEYEKKIKDKQTRDYYNGLRKGQELTMEMLGFNINKETDEFEPDEYSGTVKHYRTRERIHKSLNWELEQPDGKPMKTWMNNFTLYAGVIDALQKQYPDKNLFSESSLEFKEPVDVEVHFSDGTPEKVHIPAGTKMRHWRGP